MDQEFLKKFKTTKNRVDYVLDHIPETRNDDKLLATTLWKLFHPEYIIDGRFITLESLQGTVLDYFPSIVRIRTRFNSQGKYLPTDPKVLEARGLMEDNYREAMGYPPKSEVMYPVNPEKQESYTTQILIK